MLLRARRVVANRASAAVARLRDARFRTALVHDPRAPALLLSPHLDDAVINCWSVLTGHDPVVVVNVFAGIPRGVPPSDWDRLCGADDAGAFMRERIVEDAAALARTGHAPVNLGFLAKSYRRPSTPPPLRAMDAALSERVDVLSAIYAPVGVAHVDHRHARRYAEAIGQAGIPVRLYADAPYGTKSGWPPWVTGNPPDPRHALERTWDAAPIFPARHFALPVALAPAVAAAKLEAMRGYRTQFRALDGGPIGLLSNPQVHAYEVFWNLPPLAPLHGPNPS